MRSWYIALLLPILVVTIVCCMWIEPFETPSFEYYNHTLQNIINGYVPKEYPVAHWILFFVNMFTGDVKTSISILSIICVALSVFILGYMYRDVGDGDGIIYLSVVCLFVVVSPYTFMMIRNSLLRNIVALPILATVILIINSDDTLTGRGAYLLVGTLFMLFLTHDMSFIIGVMYTLFYILLGDNRREVKITVLLSCVIGIVTVLYVARVGWLPWMIENIGLNLPRFFETFIFVPVAYSVFMCVIASYDPMNLSTKVLAFVGILLHMSTWIAPQGIGLRLQYYTLFPLIVSSINNLKQKRYVGLILFTILTTFGHFVSLLLSIL